jgi:hypothetical protein
MKLIPSMSNTDVEKMSHLYVIVEAIGMELAHCGEFERVHTNVYYMTDNAVNTYPKPKVWYVNITAESKNEYGDERYEFDFTCPDIDQILKELDAWFEGMKKFVTRL